MKGSEKGRKNPVTIAVEPEWEIRIEEHEGREYITLHRKPTELSKIKREE